MVIIGAVEETTEGSGEAGGCCPVSFDLPAARPLAQLDVTLVVAEFDVVGDSNSLSLLRRTRAFL